MESLTQVTTVCIHADKTVYMYIVLYMNIYMQMCKNLVSPTRFGNGDEEKVHYYRRQTNFKMINHAKFK